MMGRASAIGGRPAGERDGVCELGSVVPEALWLTALSLSAEGGGGRLRRCRPGLRHGVT